MTLYITFSVVFKFYVTSIRVGGNRECCGNDEPHIVSTNSPPHKPVLSAKSMNSLSLSRDPKLEHQFVQKIVNRAGVCPQEDGRVSCDSSSNFKLHNASLTLSPWESIPNGFTLGSMLNETVKSSDPIDRERMFAPKVKKNI